MSGRTTGRATVTGYHPHITAGGRVIADCWPISSQTGRANARRLAICWNALEGLDDDAVEKLGAYLEGMNGDQVRALIAGGDA